MPVQPVRLNWKLAREGCLWEGCPRVVLVCVCGPGGGGRCHNEQKFCLTDNPMGLFVLWNLALPVLGNADFGPGHFFFVFL